MSVLLKGKPVADALNARTGEKAEKLKAEGIYPKMAVIRCGAREEDLSYERGVLKRFTQLGIATEQVILSEDVSQEEFFSELNRVNQDSSIHGILMFRPLPKQLDEEKARKTIKPEKDVDGCTDGSLAGVFAGTETGYAPCTAQAVIELLDYYGIDAAGKKVAVLGRSLVIGRPVAMLLMHRNATPFILHSKTKDIASLTKQADIIVAAIGRAEMLDKSFVRPGQVIIDVGINWSEKKQKLVGDVDFEEVEPIVDAITPVPGGVGAITTSVLAAHVVEAAGRNCI